MIETMRQIRFVLPYLESYCAIQWHLFVVEPQTIRFPLEFFLIFEYSLNSSPISIPCLTVV
jgi:hypothetical protein